MLLQTITNNQETESVPALHAGQQEGQSKRNNSVKCEQNFGQTFKMSQHWKVNVRKCPKKKSSWIIFTSIQYMTEKKFDREVIVSIAPSLALKRM